VTTTTEVQGAIKAKKEVYELFVFIHGEDFVVCRKPLYEELEQSVKDIEQESHESTRTDEALRESESRYRRLFETAQDGILILDVGTGQIADVNPFLLEMLGYTHNEFLDKKLWEIGLFRDVEESRSVFKELQEKGYVRYDHLPSYSGHPKKSQIRTYDTLNQYKISTKNGIDLLPGVYCNFTPNAFHVA